MKKSLQTILTITTLTLFLLTIIIVVSGTIAHRNNRLISLFGYSYSVVATDSMEPTIMTGEIIIIKSIPFSEVKGPSEDGAMDGDIIVYQSEVYGVNLVHRVIEVLSEEELQTRGDNPRAPLDPETVTEEKLLGIVVGHITLLNIGMLTLQYRNMIFFLVIVVFVFILISELIRIVKHVKTAQQEELSKEREKEKEEMLEQIKKELEEEIKQTKQD